MRALALLVVAGVALPVCSWAHGDPWYEPGTLVGVAVEVEGSQAPLYAAPDGSGRFYLEAREGARYAVRLSNRTGERLGVALTVDGLNAISGERASGRMYVLDAWESTTVGGWRTSLDEVRRFTFVDERASYAARSGRANARMGWIQVAVHRERPRSYVRRWYEDGRVTPVPRDFADREREEARKDYDPPAAAAPAPESKSRDDAAPGYAPHAQRSYPGTGWGERRYDRAEVVAFEPEPSPAERTTLRYEYAATLRALGILPGRWPGRDRLWQREHAVDGFAKPPDR